MNSTPRKGFIGWLKDFEARGDAWAAKRLSADEYADAVALDRQLKRHFWRWLAIFALATLGFAAMAWAIWPGLGWGRAILLSGAGCLYLVFAVGSPWYGYRKWTKNPAWKIFASFVALAVAGAVMGFAVANWEAGREITSVDWDKAARAIVLALMTGVVLAAVLVGISRMRLREVSQRAARLQADAERERLARQTVQAELKLLQAQVEPHFLFNTLANVRYLVQTNSPDALAMLDHLISYLRTALPEIRSEGSTLAREAELARAYLEIMRLRMGGALEVAIDVPPELAHTPFPPLMVITLVENAIKHGVAPVGRGKVSIRARALDGRLRVEVEDDGRGLLEPIGRGVGLANIRERLAALFGPAARLDLAGLESGGTRAMIEVPER